MWRSLLSRQEDGGYGDSGQGLLMGLQLRVGLGVLYPHSQVSLHLTIFSDQILALSSVISVVVFEGVCKYGSELKYRNTCCISRM